MGPRKNWTEDAMSKALADTRAGTSVRAAAVKWAVPKSTLHDRVRGKVEQGSRPGPPPKLSHEDERKLVDYAAKRASQGLGFGKKPFLKYAGNLASKRHTPFKNQKPSDKWWRLLKQRHQGLKNTNIEDCFPCLFRISILCKGNEFYHYPTHKYSNDISLT